MSPLAIGLLIGFIIGSLFIILRLVYLELTRPQGTRMIRSSAVARAKQEMEERCKNES